MTTNAEILAQKIATADAHHAQYPQYKGHFDGYRLARVTRRVKTKAGTAAEAGDIVLAKVEAAILPGLESYVVFYSERTRVDTSVSGLSSVEFL